MELEKKSQLKLDSLSYFAESEGLTKLDNIHLYIIFLVETESYLILQIVFSFD